MMICTPGDFVSTFALGAVTVAGLYVAWKLWRVVQHASKYADRKKKESSHG